MGLKAIKETIDKALKLKDLREPKPDHNEEWLVKYSQEMIKRSLFTEYRQTNQHIARLEKKLRKNKEEDLLN